MKNLILSLAQVFSKAAWYIFGLSILIIVAFGWLSFLRDGPHAFGSGDLQLSLLGGLLSERQLQELFLVFSQQRLIAVFGMLFSTLLALSALLPLYWIKEIFRPLRLQNLFVSANTTRLRYLAIYFLAFMLIGFILQMILPFYISTAKMDLSLTGIWWVIFFCLLSYMNQQGVALKKEAELTV